MGTNTTTKPSSTVSTTATSIEDSVKSIYITIDPNNYEAGKERLRRAVRRCKSVDDIDYLNLDDNDAFLVPWYSVATDPNTVAAVQNLQRKASISPMKSRREEDDAKAHSKSAKAKKKADPNAKVKTDFFKILNVKNPANGCSGFNVSKVNKMLDDLPALACAKYLFGAFTEPVTACICCVRLTHRCRASNVAIRTIRPPFTIHRHFWVLLCITRVITTPTLKLFGTFAIKKWTIISIPYCVKPIARNARHCIWRA